MFSYTQWSYKLFSTIGVLIHLLLLDIPRDLLRWLTLSKKDVQGQVIVITGASSGLGQRMAQIFAKEHKAKIAVVDVNEEGGKETVTSINESGGEAKFWKCDISKVDQMNQVAKEIEEHYGQVDIVVCNAAVLYFAFFMELTSEQLQKAVDVNIIGTINTMRAFLSKMEERNSGHIVTVSSIAGWAGETYGASYCPTKFAVRAAMECLQMELRDRGLTGIKCTTVCPYFARTPMVLEVGMRPTSTWIPFMSVNSCSRRIIDAILKEKVMAFMPNYVHLVPLIKGFLSVNCARSLRDYLNCRYEPSETSQIHKSSRKILPVVPDYFQSASTVWWISSLVFRIVIFLSWYNGALLSAVPVLGPMFFRLVNWCPQLPLIANIIISLVHLVPAVSALRICEDLRFTFACRLQWFVQTFLLGFPSLKLLNNYQKSALKQE